MVHVTFKNPPPRLVLSKRSTPIVAVYAELAGTEFKPSHLVDAAVELDVRTIVIDGGHRDFAMRTTLHVAQSHIASVADCGDGK